MQRLGVNTAANMSDKPTKSISRKRRPLRFLRSHLLAHALFGLPLLLSPLAASAGLKDSFGTLRIGMISPTGGRGVAGLPEITAAFERATGLPVEILVAVDYPALIRAQGENRIHYAAYSAAAYATAFAVCGCVEPLAAPLGIDGSVGTRAVLVGRSSTVQSLDDLGSARIVSGPRPVIGPLALALAALQSQDNQRPGGSMINMATQSEAEQVFLAGDADLLVGWQPAYEDNSAEVPTGTLSRLSVAAPTEALDIVWSSQILRYGPHAVRSDVPQEVKDRLRRFLINLKDQQPDIYALLEGYRGGGFATVSQADYAVAAKIINGLAKP